MAKILRLYVLLLGLDTFAIVKATGTNISDAKFLQIRKPQVVLLHGLWANRGTWEGLETFLEDSRGYSICEDSCRPSYDDIEGAAGSFDPRDEDNPTLERLAESVQEALRDYRGQYNVGVTQIDVVGHSMGGLIARAFVQYQNNIPYRSRVNRNMGYFHKIVTVGTPHQGSVLASWLEANRNERFNPPGIVPTVQLDTAFEHETQREFGPAVGQLGDGSAAIVAIGSTPVSAHAIIGLAPDGSESERALNMIPDLIESQATIDCLLGSENDTIVSTQSQGHNLSGNSATTLSNLIHADFTGQDPVDSETESDAVFEQIATALFSSVSSDVFGRFERHDGNEGVEARMTSCDETGQPEAIVVMSTRTISQSDVNIFPDPGMEVHPGETVRIGLTLDPAIDPNSVERVSLSIGRDLFSVESFPFEILYTVPEGKHGRRTINALMIGSGIENPLLSSYIIVTADSPPIAIEATPKDFTLSRVGASYPIYVSGQYPSGEADLRDPSSGTVYETVSGLSDVVTVSASGLVTAQGPGEEEILVSNMGVSTSITFRVLGSNQPPVIEEVVDVFIAPGESLSLEIRVNDSDGDTVMLALRSDVTFASFEDFRDGTALLTLTPLVTDIGSHPFVVDAIDNGSPQLADSVNFTVTIADSPPPPPGDSNLIDIKPGSNVNPINPRSRGKTPVAILSSSAFNAPAEIDRESLTFGRTGDEPSLHHRGNGEPNCGDDEDVNEDGYTDLVCHFFTQIAAFRDGDTKGFLKGRLLSGDAFEAMDTITIVGNGFDADVDGIPDEIEDEAPNNGDGNGDGLFDSFQTNVTSLRSAMTGDFITLAASPGCVNANVTALEPETVTTDPEGYIAPQGLLAFVLESCGLSDTTVYYHGAADLSNASYRRIGPIPGNTNSQWYTLPATFDAMMIDGTVVGTASFQLVDGGLGDDDLTVNGRIVDPGGPALLAPGLPSEIPTLSEVGAVILTILLLGFGVFIIGRKTGGF